MPVGDSVRFKGILPSTQSSDKREERRNDAATGASAATVRALTARAVAFYFRAPVKAFFRTRVDYMVRLMLNHRTMKIKDSDGVGRLGSQSIRKIFVLRNSGANGQASDCFQHHRP